MKTKHNQFKHRRWVERIQGLEKLKVVDFPRTRRYYWLDPETGMYRIIKRERRR